MTASADRYTNKKITYEEFRDLMLIGIADRYHDGLDEFGRNIEPDGFAPLLSIKKIADFEGYVYEADWIESVINELESEHCVTSDGRSGADDDGYGVYLDPAGWERARRLVEKYYGDETGSYDEIMELDQESQNYKAAVKNLSALIAEVRASNSYAATKPDDRERRISELEAGRTLLSSRYVSRVAIKSTLVSALIWLIDKFAGTPIEELSRATWRALLALFGQHLS